MLKGLPTRLNLLTENASEWNVFAFYPSLHWEVLHSSPDPVSRRHCRSWRSRFSSPSVPSRRSTTFRCSPTPLPFPLFRPLSPPTDVTTLPYQVSGSTPSTVLLRTSRHICPTLRKWLAVEIPRSWCVLARSGNWCDVRFFRSISFSAERAMPPRSYDRH